MTVAGSPSQTASMILYYFDYSDYDTIIGLGKVEASALADYVVATASGQTSTSSGAAGRVKQSNTNTGYTTSGNQFFARAYATFDEKTYFIDLFGGTGTGGVWVNEKTGNQTVIETLAWVEGSTAAESPYGGSTATAAGAKNAWVAVPEPSTAMLALAGLALLIKRRKA